MRRRLVGVGVLCLALSIAGWLYLQRAGPSPGSGPARIRVVEGAAALARIRSGPHVVFRNTDQRFGYGRVALAALAAPDERFVTELACERVYATRARGVCLGAQRGVVTTYDVRLLDPALAPGPSIPLTGLPSHAQVAPDGRHVAFTVLESGTSYESPGVSPRTTIVDASSSVPLPPLEDWQVLRDGAPFRETGFRLACVTFAPDGDHLYASLGNGREVFLVEGSMAGRELHVVREDVECPSLSPDGRRLAFKSRRTEGGRVLWGLRVLELETGVEAPLDGETRSVEDQPAWLDDGHLLYGLPEERAVAAGGSDVWVIEARPGAAPRILLEQAWSPAVVR